MIIKKADQNYQIRELEYKKKMGMVTFSWRFMEETDFLVFIYDSRQEFNLTAAKEIVEEAGFRDQDIINNTKKLVTLRKNRNLKMLHIGRREFINNNRRLQFPVNEFKKNIPYGISVYACKYIEDGKKVYIYQAVLEDNTCFFPVLISADIKYKKMPFSKDKLCILQLPVIDGYKDGAIMYHVSGIVPDFPLPQQCLGRELVITIPRQSEVSIRIQEKYKKYYKDR